MKSPGSKDETFYVRRPAETLPAFPELAVVALRKPARTMDNVSIPAGTIGAVVAVWDHGASYEIEFAEPAGALATVPREHLREVETAA